jgi:hypothetical protein
MPRRPLLLPLLLFLLLAAFGVHPVGGTGHPVMPSPYPTITHAAGTNALTFAASLDRAGTVFYVVATQPNGLDGGGTTAPTPTEVFAGTLSGGGVATASGKLTFASANVERSAVIERLPDASVFDVYVAAHTDADAAPSGTPSPTTTSALAAATIQDVTPPAFAASTPHAVGHGPTYLTIAIAANENATAHVMILTADGAFYLTLVPIRSRWRGERRSLRTFPGVSLRPHLAFNPRPRRLSTPSDAFQLHPDVALYGTTLRRVRELTKGASLESNIALVKNNARVGSEIALALTELEKQPNR